MFRSILMAVGIFLLILGGESLIVDKVVITESRRISKMIDGNRYSNSNPFQNAGYQQQNYYGQSVASGPRKSYQTKDWMPWSLLAAGSIIVLYTYSLPKVDGGE